MRLLEPFWLTECVASYITLQQCLDKFIHNDILFVLQNFCILTMLLSFRHINPVVHVKGL